MKEKKIFLEAIIISCVLLLGGCGGTTSLVIETTYNEDEEQSEMQTEANAEEKEEEKEKKTTEAFETIKIDTNQEKEKYNIGGENAFHFSKEERTKLKDELINFELIDFIDGNTTIYAYQIIDNAGDNESKLKTEVMLYNISEKKAKKIASWNDDIVVITTTQKINSESTESTETESTEIESTEQIIYIEEEKVNDNIDITKILMKYDGIEVDDNAYSFFTKKISKDLYMFFYNQKQIFFSKDKIQKQIDFVPILGECFEYFDKNKLYTISDVEADENYNTYITFNVESMTINTDNDDLNDLDNDDLNDLDIDDLNYEQILLTVSPKDISGYENSEGNINETVTDKFFITENQNYEAQKKQWQADEGTSFDLGILEEDPDIAQSAQNEAVKKKDVLKEVPDSFPDKYKYSKENDFSLWWVFRDIDENKFSGNKVKYYKQLPGIKPKKNEAVKYDEIKKYVKSNTDNEASEIQFIKEAEGERIQFIGEPEKDDNGLKKMVIVQFEMLPSTIEYIKTECSKTVNLKWTKNEIIGKDKDGKDIIQEKSETADVVLNEEFVEASIIRFPKDTEVYYCELTNIKDNILIGPQGKVLRCKDGETESGDELTLFSVSSETKNDITIQGTYLNQFLINSDTCKTVYWLETEKNFFVMDNFETYLSISGIGTAQNASTQNIIKAQNLNYLYEKENTYSEQQYERFADTYIEQGVKVEKTDGVRWLYISGLNIGLLKYNLDEKSEKYIWAGQLSPYPYYAINIDSKKNVCHAIGFQNLKYNYTPNDLYEAKLYTINMSDDEANANMVISALNQNPALKDEIINKGLQSNNDKNDVWQGMLTKLGVEKQWDSNQEISTVKAYYSLIVDSQNKKKQAIENFFGLAGCKYPNKNDEKYQKILNRLDECYYSTSLENVLVEEIYYLNPMLLNEQLKKLNAQWGTQIKAGDNIYKDINDLEKINKKVRYSDYKGSILIAIKKVNENLQDDKAWQRTLDRIARDMNPPETIEESKQMNAIEEFSNMANVDISVEMEGSIKKIAEETKKTADETEKVKKMELLIAGYHLSYDELSIFNAGKPKEENFTNESSETQYKVMLDKYTKIENKYKETIKKCKANWGIRYKNLLNTSNDIEYEKKLNELWQKKLLEIIDCFVVD